MRRSLMLLGLLLLPGWTGAAPITAPQAGSTAIEVNADRLLVEERKNQAVYSGNVVVQRGDLRISADRVTIFGAGKVVQRIVANGNPVKFAQGDRHGEGQQLVYEPQGDLVTLTGNAHVWQGRNEVAGERIVYHVREQRTEVSGKSGQRVKSIFYSGDTAATPGAVRTDGVR